MGLAQAGRITISTKDEIDHPITVASWSFTFGVKFILPMLVIITILWDEP